MMFRLEIVVIACFGCLALGAGTLGAQSHPTTDSIAVRKALAGEALEIFRKQDSFAAISHISRHEDPVVATQVFGDLAHRLYWKEKDLPASVAIARAGVQFGLAAGDRLEETESAKALEARSVAKAIAYDIASFTWPGWDEKGVEIGKSDLYVGLDAARLNLRLAKSLDKGETPLGRAHWMLGAQLLAQAKHEEARDQFVEAVKRFVSAKNRGEELLAEGFTAMADLLRQPGDNEARAALDRVKSHLAGIEEGKFFADQLAAAWKVFSKP